MKAKIYLIKMKEWDYDECDGFVVQAKNKKTALKLCNIPSESKWSRNLTLKNVELVKIVGTAKNQKEELLLTSFNAG